VPSTRTPPRVRQRGSPVEGGAGQVGASDALLVTLGAPGQRGGLATPPARQRLRPNGPGRGRGARPSNRPLRRLSPVVGTVGSRVQGGGGRAPAGWDSPVTLPRGEASGSLRRRVSGVGRGGGGGARVLGAPGGVCFLWGAARGFAAASLSGLGNRWVGRRCGGRSL